MNRSDLHALQTFLAIADQGSLRAAARVLGVNPPAISHQLKNFEDRLGTPLFVRTTRSVTLTDAGQTLYDGSRYLLGAIQDTVDNTRNAAQAKTGQLRITLPFRAWQVIVAPKLAGFQDAYPGIELDLTIEESLTDIIQGGFHAGVRALLIDKDKSPHWAPDTVEAVQDADVEAFFQRPPEGDLQF